MTNPVTNPWQFLVHDNPPNYSINHELMKGLNHTQQLWSLESLERHPTNLEHQHDLSKFFGFNGGHVPISCDLENTSWIVQVLSVEVKRGKKQRISPPY